MAGNLLIYEVFLISFYLGVISELQIYIPFGERLLLTSQHFNFNQTRRS